MGIFDNIKKNGLLNGLARSAGNAVGSIKNIPAQVLEGYRETQETQKQEAKAEPSCEDTSKEVVEAKNEEESS